MDERKKGGEVFIFVNSGLLLVILMVGAGYDIREQRIPNWWCLLGCLCGLCLTWGTAPVGQKASIMAHDCKRLPKGKKIDMSVAVGVIHILCPVFTGFLSGTVTRFRIRSDMEYLSHCLTEVRPGRSFERLRRKRKTSGKFYRHLNFSLSV